VTYLQNLAILIIDAPARPPVLVALMGSLCWLLKYLRSCATAATVVFVVFVYDHYFSILMWLGVGAFFISASLNGLEDRTIVGSRGSFAGLLVSSSVS
jgi:hypothetical protein